MRCSSHSLWRHANFRRLWAAQTASAAGAEMTRLAVPTLAIFAFAATPLQVGALVAIPYLVYLIVGLPTGVLVDRLPRRRVMIVADLGRFLALGALPLGWALGWLHVWHLFAAVTVTGVCTVIVQIAERSYLPQLVPSPALLEANANLTLGEGAAHVLGPSLAGALMQVIGAPLTLLGNAASFGFSALVLRRIRETHEMDPVLTRAPAAGQGVIDAMREGLRFVLRHPLLRPILAINVIGNFGAGMVEGVALVFVYQELHLTPGAVGAAMALGSAGFLLGAVAAPRVTRGLGVGWTLAGSSVIYACAPVALALGALGPAFVAVLLWRLIYGMALPPYDVNAATIRQATTPDHLQGRAIAVINTVGWGALGLGPLAGGWLGQRLGLPPTILLGAAVSMLGAIPAFAPQVRRMRSLPQQAAEGLA